jgi:hypothetical protein
LYLNFFIWKKDFTFDSLLSKLKNKTTVANWAIIEEIYTFRKVTYYTIRIEDETYSETEKFITRFELHPQYQNDFENILALLVVLGNEKGAKSRFFRDESAAQALPPEVKIALREGWVQFIDAGLRLFCLRMTDEVVILLNGGIKSSQKTNDSPDLIYKFRLAQQVSKAIDVKLSNREMQIVGKRLIGDLEISF